MSFFEDASLVLIPSAQKLSKIYSIKPTDGTGDLTFTRSNDTATRVASNGLIEKVRTNVILQSNTFSNASWTKTDSTVTSGQSGYDGTTNAWLLSKSASAGRVTQDINTSGLKTFSLYAKAGTANWIAITFTQAESYSYFNISNGTLGTAFGTDIIARTITSVGSGWYRISISVNNTSTNNNIYVADSDGAVSGTSGNILIQAAQTETGDIATPYIATTSAAVSVGPVANVPRLDYLNSSCPRLLLEPQRSNLVPFSESFDNAGWVKNNATITANSVVSPDGYTNADTYTATGAGNYVNGNATSTGSNTITYSVFAKAGTQNVLRIREANYFGSATIFNLSTGTVTSGTGTITSYGNGWYRCTHSQAYGVGQIIVSAIFDTTASSGTFYLYGAQFEAGAYATSYIPTLGSASTRGSDTASKTSVSSLVGGTEGTIYVEGFQNVPATAVPFQLSDGTNNNRVQIEVSSVGAPLCVVTSGGSTQAVIVGGSMAVGTARKIAITYKANEFKLYQNGVLIGSDTSGSIPVGLSAIYFGSESGSVYTGFTYNQALSFQTALSEADAIALTTI